MEIKSLPALGMKTTLGSNLLKGTYERQGNHYMPAVPDNVKLTYGGDCNFPFPYKLSNVIRGDL